MHKRLTDAIRRYGEDDERVPPILKASEYDERVWLEARGTSVSKDR